MTVRRLYAPKLPDRGGLVELDDAAARHVRVLRLRVGQQVDLFDGKGRVARARILSVGAKVECEASRVTVSERDDARVVLLLGIPKGSKLDDCIRSATELGVDEVALMQTERTVPRWDSAKLEARLDRLARIAAEAAAQCERAEVPVISGPRSCAEWIARLPPGAQGVVFGARADSPLTLQKRTEQVWCAVGPEGGFTDAELSAFEAADFVVASLGRWILRVDTAVTAALAIVRDRLASMQAR